VKHVNDEFWRQWVPAVLEAAHESGREDFFMYGEVFSSDPIFNSHFTTNLGFPSVLDFVLHEALEQYVARDQPADVMAQAFDRDDWFTDTDSNASMQVTFFGNHDIGRMGRIISSARPGVPANVLLDKMLLGFDLLFLSRGVPVIYYGDEQGFVGDGGDRGARQTMFPATASRYVGQATIGSDATVSDDNFDPTHPLYVRVADLNRLRAEHPALVTGAHVVGEPQGPVLSFSRIDREERIEYLVVANNGPLAIPASVRALSADMDFEVIHGGEGSVRSAADGTVQVEVPARSALVLRATEELAVPSDPPTIRIVRPDPDTVIPTNRYRIEAEIGDRRYAEVTFSISIAGDEPVVLGTDDAPPYRVYWNNQDIPAGTSVELIVVVSDGSGRYAADTRTVTLGSR
ncbi:MAG: alpha-amylase family glycosyl hydrolase, partial [Acidimicrobiia bacterium]|nr:alpha-amylase family glycosyl hydrolase [Acidimicrobiia bacterium]